MADWGMPAAFAMLGTALMAWNLALGARVTTLPGTGPAFRMLSGLGAFLLVPALVIGLLSPTAAGARVLEPLAWLWPVVVVGVAAQALWALLSARTSAIVAFPILLFDLVAAWVAVSRSLEGYGAQLPAWMLAPGAAVSSLVAAALGDGAFLWSAAALFPLLVPAAPARWRLSGAWRACVAVWCTVVVVLVGAEIPGAYSALTANQTTGERAMPERARTEFAVGLRLFGTLAGAPPSAVARGDVALADSLGITALHIELLPEAATIGALDSMARSIAARRDSLVLVVTLDLSRSDRRSLSTDDAWLRARTRLLERIVTRLHPDVLLPADGVAPSRGAADAPSWRSYYEHVARSARRLDRDVTIALATDAGSAADSALCDWVLGGGTPVDAIALAVRTHGDAPALLDGALAAMTRWVSLGRAAPSVWLLGVPASPAVFGELAQQRLVRHALVWGASHDWVRGVIAGDASDVLASTGMRTPTGRTRTALSEVGAAVRALRDAPPAALPALDTAKTDALRAFPDTLTGSRP